MRDEQVYYAISSSLVKGHVKENLLTSKHTI